jgi:NTE family protein
MSEVADKRYALVLSGGGVRATAFHLGVILRLAVDGQLERVRALSTVSGGSLAAGLVFSRAGLAWPSSDEFVKAILPQAGSALAEHSLQGSAFVRTLGRPWKLFASRGDILAEAVEKVWGISGTLKEIAEEPRWFINATCYETGRNWRFSQKHIGDWKFGHNFTQSVPISLAIAASAAIPYMAGLVKLSIDPDGWFSVNPATDEPGETIRPIRDAIRLWDGGVYENLGMEAVYKPQRGFVDKDIGLMIISDASAYLGQALGPATGVFTIKYPFLRPPRLFDIATEQTRSLRARILMEAIIDGRLPGTIVRLGRSVDYIDNQAKRQRKELSRDAFLAKNAVDAAARYPTNASQMTMTDYRNLLRHGFETADATLTGYRPMDFPRSFLWADIIHRLGSR